MVVPREGVGWDLEATGLVRGAHDPEAAKAFIDWAMSPDAMRLYARNLALVADPEISTPPPGLPKDLAAHLAPTDLRWTAANRDRIIAAWTRRYGGKSKPQP